VASAHYTVEGDEESAAAAAAAAAYGRRRQLRLRLPAAAGGCGRLWCRPRLVGTLQGPLAGIRVHAALTVRRKGTVSAFANRERAYVIYAVLSPFDGKGSKYPIPLVKGKNYFTPKKTLKRKEREKREREREGERELTTTLMGVKGEIYSCAVLGSASIFPAILFPPCKRRRKRYWI